jgi:hypothetical protein
MSDISTDAMMREAAMMDASDNHVWARKVRRLCIERDKLKAQIAALSPADDAPKDCGCHQFAVCDERAGCALIGKPDAVEALVKLMPEVLASLDATGCNVSLARDLRAALAPAEAGGVEGLHTAGRDMLALHDGFLSGADVDRPAANRLHLAASFGAQAFAVCPIPDARPAAMIRAIALALIDPMHSDLDYLRRVNMARPVEAPMMTDLMVDPGNIDDFLAANPLPPTHVGDSEQPETAINAAPVDALVKAARESALREAADLANTTFHGSGTEAAAIIRMSILALIGEKP